VQFLPINPTWSAFIAIYSETVAPANDSGATE